MLQLSVTVELRSTVVFEGVISMLVPNGRSAIIRKHTLELVIPSRITECKGNTLEKRFPPDLLTCKLTVLDFHEVPVIINF